MDDFKNEIPEDAESSSYELLIKRVTTEMLMNYWTSLENKIGHDVACSMCGDSRWIVQTTYVNNKPIPEIIYLPFIRNVGKARWMFSLRCATCGKAELIDAFHVAVSLSQQEGAVNDAE